MQRGKMSAALASPAGHLIVKLCKEERERKKASQNQSWNKMINFIV